MSRGIESVLKSFIRHVVDLQNEDDPAGSGFTREFRILREKQIADKNEDRFLMLEGKKEENIKKNRYKDILPRDDRRVKLKEIPGEPGSDYINASFIDDVDGHRGYIAAQGPMPHTVVDFWRMLWQYKTEIVFMACRLKEDAKAKCEKYWPDERQTVAFGNIKVYTESEEEIQDHFIKRQIHAEKNGTVHRLTQFQYVGWPDHNVPSSPDALRRMIEDVRNHRKRLNIPMVVHCSAGCGRTGTICAIDFAWTLLDRGMVSEGFSMFEVIKSLREQRISMVQTPDQYEYTHMVMKSLCGEWLASFTKHDYENVVLNNQEPEEPEDTYYNVDFQHDQSNLQDVSRAKPLASKESGAGVAAASSRLVIGKKPEIKSHKPEITRPKPEISTQKMDVSKPKPQGRSSPNAPAAHAASYEGGRHASVRQTSSTPTPSSRQDARGGELFSQEAPDLSKISKTGSASRAAIKHKTRPPVVQVAAGGGQGDRGRQGVAGSKVDEDASVYMLVEKKNTNVKAPMYENHLLYENHHVAPGSSRLLPDGNYSNEVIGGQPTEDPSAPALPSRQYKMEEVTSLTSRGSKPAHPSSTDASSQHRPKYGNVTPVPTSHPPNAPKGNVHRTQQPTPINPPSAPKSTPHQARGGQAVSPRTARRQGQAVADSSSSSSSSADKGQLSAGAASRPNVVQPRPGWVENTPSHARRDFPGIFSAAHGRFQEEPPSGRSSGASDRQKHIVAAPGPGQVIEARTGTTLYVLERVPRVRGPRPQPTGWTAHSRNQRGHYL